MKVQFSSAVLTHGHHWLVAAMLVGADGAFLVGIYWSGFESLLYVKK